MVLSHDSSNQLPLLGFSSRFRRLGAGSSVSIWAPQPSENILPRALYSSSHAVQEEKPYFQRATSQQKFANPPLIAQEDVFGRLDVMFHSIKDVGVTSDARKKNTPEGGDTVDACYHYPSSVAFSYYFLRPSSNCCALLTSIRLLWRPVLQTFAMASLNPHL